MTIDHLALNVPAAIFQECLEFYTAALEPLGYEARQQLGETLVGFGLKDKVFGDYKPANFWLAGVPEAPNNKTHLAFTAPDRPAVDAFHLKATAAGGRDNGGPGPRPYHAAYYGAFVHDPAGNNIEAVCHKLPA